MTTPQHPIFDPDTCEKIFWAALGDGDIKGVESALMVMAPQDPRRADRLFTKLKQAVEIDAATRPGGTP